MGQNELSLSKSFKLPEHFLNRPIMISIGGSTIKNNERIYLSVKEGVLSRGSNIWFDFKNGTYAQQWMIKKDTSDVYTIQLFKDETLVVDVERGKKENGS